MNTLVNLALIPAHPAPAHPAFNLGYAIALLAVLLLSVVLSAFLIRKVLRDGSRTADGDWTSPKADLWPLPCKA
jgi:hypothetical protein